MAIFEINYLCKTLRRSICLNAIIPFEKLECQREVKFKTVYLLPGFCSNQYDWLHYSNIRKLAEKYKLAVVLPNGENSFYLDFGHLSQYDKFILELVDFTRNAFPLSKKRSDTFIGGISMGGFGALRLGTFYYDVFSKIVSLSGAFIVDNIANAQQGYSDRMASYEYYSRIFGNLQNVKGGINDPLSCIDKALSTGKIPDIYLICAENDYLVVENRAMWNELKKRNVNAEYHEYPGEHNWDFWNTHIEDSVKWLLK